MTDQEIKFAGLLKGKVKWGVTAIVRKSQSRRRVLSIEEKKRIRKHKLLRWRKSARTLMSEDIIPHETDKEKENIIKEKVIKKEKLKSALKAEQAIKKCYTLIKNG